MKLFLHTPDPTRYAHADDTGREGPSHALKQRWDKMSRGDACSLIDDKSVLHLLRAMSGDSGVQEKNCTELAQYLMGEHSFPPYSGFRMPMGGITLAEHSKTLLRRLLQGETGEAPGNYQHKLTTLLDLLEHYEETRVRHKKAVNLKSVKPESSHGDIDDVPDEPSDESSIDIEFRNPDSFNPTTKTVLQQKLEKLRETFEDKSGEVESKKSTSATSSVPGEKPEPVVIVINDGAPSLRREEDFVPSSKEASVKDLVPSGMTAQDLTVQLVGDPNHSPLCEALHKGDARALQTFARRLQEGLSGTAPLKLFDDPATIAALQACLSGGHGKAMPALARLMKLAGVTPTQLVGLMTSGGAADWLKSVDTIWARKNLILAMGGFNSEQLLTLLTPQTTATGNAKGPSAFKALLEPLATSDEAVRRKRDVVRVYASMIRDVVLKNGMNGREQRRLYAYLHNSQGSIGFFGGLTNSDGYKQVKADSSLYNDYSRLKKDLYDGRIFRRSGA